MAAKATTPDRPERDKGPGPATRPVPGVARLEARVDPGDRRRNRPAAPRPVTTGFVVLLAKPNRRDAPMRFTIIISLLAAALGLAACGSSSPSGTATNASAGQRPDASSSKTLEFASCVRSHGVSTFPDPTGRRLPLQIQQTPNSTTVNGVEVNGPAFQSAMQACRSYMPNAGTPSAAQTAKAKSPALAMSRCMRSHGRPAPSARSLQGSACPSSAGCRTAARASRCSRTERRSARRSG